MTDQVVQMTEVVETTGDKPFLTLMGVFHVFPDTTIPEGHKRTHVKDAFVNPKDYEEKIRGKSGIEVVRAIKELKEVQKN